VVDAWIHYNGSAALLAVRGVAADESPNSFVAVASAAMLLGAEGPSAAGSPPPLWHEPSGPNSPLGLEGISELSKISRPPLP